MPCLLTEYVVGDSLLPAMRAGEAWAQALYIDTVRRLQAVARESLGPVAQRLGEGETAVDLLEAAHRFFQQVGQPLADAACARLLDTLPRLPAPRFSNGDLYPDNRIIRDRRLAGIID